MLSLVAADTVPVPVPVVFESVPLLAKDPVGDGATKTVVGITIVVVPSSSSEEVSGSNPRLEAISDNISLRVEDDVAR